MQQKHGKATETPEGDAAPSAPPATAGAEPMDVDDEEAIEVCASVLEAASADPSREAARAKAFGSLDGAWVSRCSREGAD